MLEQLEALLSPSHPQHREARKQIEKQNPHFNTKELAMKAGVLVLLAGIACYPKIKSEAKLLGEKGRRKLEGRGGDERGSDGYGSVKGGRGRRRTYEGDGESERYGSVANEYRRSDGRKSERVERRPPLGSRTRSRSEGWYEYGGRSGMRVMEWDDGRRRYEES